MTEHSEKTSNRIESGELLQLINTGDAAQLQRYYESVNPAVFAEALGLLDDELIIEALHLLEPKLRGDAFSHLDEDKQQQIADLLDNDRLAIIVENMPHDDRVDLLKEFSEEENEELMERLTRSERDDIKQLADYDEGTAGAVMTSDFSDLPAYITVENAIRKLRRDAADKETIYCNYVIDAKGRLLGYVTLEKLILAEEDKLVSEIMNPVKLYCHVNDDQEKAARDIAKYDMLAMPVVDENHVIKGIITHDDAMEIIQDENTEDIERFMGISGEHEAGTYRRTSIWEHFRKRVGWLVVLAILGLVSGAILHYYESTLSALIILALYLPMITGTGGNAGSQTATVIIQALATKEISIRDFLPVICKEMVISLMLALVLAAITIGRVLFLSHNVHLPGQITLMSIGICIAVALCIQVMISNLMGAFLPLFVSLFKVDPAIVASPALATVVDVTGMVIYFGTVKLMLGI